MGFQCYLYVILGAVQSANIKSLTRMVEYVKPLRPASLTNPDHATNSFIEENIQGGCNDCVLMQYIPRLHQSLTIREIRMIIILDSNDRFTVNDITKSHIFAFL